MSQDPTQHNERARLVGEISFQWSYLEYLVSNVVWYFIGINKEVGTIVTGHLDIKPELQIARELTEHAGASNDLQGTLKRLSKNFDSRHGLPSRRNVIVHGIYATRDGDPKVMVEAHKSKTWRERQEMPLSYMQETLDQLSSEVSVLVTALEAEGINVH